MEPAKSINETLARIKDKIPVGVREGYLGNDYSCGPAFYQAEKDIVGGKLFLFNRWYEIIGILDLKVANYAREDKEIST